ncbi:MAG TPA: alpha/beta hydrolase [Candidatus Limnocylindria bacterium]|nr:alpha/beta hydrolase [Candidatus Limnocylindria bacterium]
MTVQPENRSAPIVLVPGFWLGAWAWDEVADILRRDGHRVAALTLPGMDSDEGDRSGITFNDHVEAIAAAVRDAGEPAVLAVHSATGYSGYAASDRVADRIAAMVYVDTGPGIGAMDPEATEDKALPSPEDLANEENLTGLSEEQLATMRERAVSVPVNVLREGAELTNDARKDIPSAMICTGYTVQEYKEAVQEGYGFLAGLKELRNVTWIDLPTSHWPKWSRPADLAEIIGRVATEHARQPAAQRA